jgi:hypothetical protein
MTREQQIQDPLKIEQRLQLEIMVFQNTVLCHWDYGSQFVDKTHCLTFRVKQFKEQYSHVGTSRYVMMYRCWCRQRRAGVGPVGWQPRALMGIAWQVIGTEQRLSDMVMIRWTGACAVTCWDCVVPMGKQQSGEPDGRVLAWQNKKCYVKWIKFRHQLEV